MAVSVQSLAPTKTPNNPLMIDYGKCKCGSVEAFGSMPPSPCDKCTDCDTGYGWGTSHYREPREHEFVSKEIETDNGPQPLSRCKWCHNTRKQIADQLIRDGKVVPLYENPAEIADY